MESYCSFSVDRIWRVNPRMVGVINSSTSGTNTSNSRCILDIITAAFKECPPSSKKLASVLMASGGITNTSDQMVTNAASISLSGARYFSPSFTCGSGSAFRLTLPLVVSGRRSSVTKYDGIIYDGRCRDKYSRSWGISGAFNPDLGAIYAQRYFSPLSVSLSMTAASSIAPCFNKKLSISPNSMRNPRIFTW